MKQFNCPCGQRVFFENTLCLNCGRSLGFDPVRMELRAFRSDGSLLRADDGSTFRYCGNQADFGNCNWLVEATAGHSRCLSCAMNRVIPALAKPQNLLLWTRVEQAKRRLIYSLLRYRLPFEANGTRLNFRIMEDRRRNPAVLESFIATGHLEGTITINVAEADDAARHAIREQLQERYRTVLGHLRHEAGHFYFRVLAQNELLDECRRLFGDEREDYDGALARYYAEGAAADWPQHYVSAYASAHPAEDFAETFAHVLHIDDALQTAREAGFLGPAQDSDDSWIDIWVGLAISLNEIIRGLGEDDPYPFVISETVRRKFELINRLLTRSSI